MSSRFCRFFSITASRNLIDIKPFVTLNIEKFGPLTAAHHFSFGKYNEPKRMRHGLLRVFDDGLIKGKMNMPMHPHRNIDIVSVVLPENQHPHTDQIEGGSAIIHEDNRGNREVIHPGNAQIMSVGSDGVEHSEFLAENSKSANAFQIWLRQSEKQRTSSYGTRTLSRNVPGLWNVLASGAPTDDGVSLKSSSRILSLLLKPGQSARYEMKNDRLGYLVASSGVLEINNLRLYAHDAAVISSETSLSIKAIGDVESLIVLVDTVEK